MTRKIQVVVTSVLILFAAATTAHSAIVGTATQVNWPAGGYPFNAPEAALPAPWVAYQLSISTTAPGELIGAVEVNITGGKLHQRWTDIDFDGIVDPSPQSPNASDGRGDSHLTAPAGSPFGIPATETNTHSGSPLTSTPGSVEYGLGNLSGGWGILPPAASTNIAYVVFQGSNNQIEDWYFSGLDIAVTAFSPSGAPSTLDKASFRAVPLPPIPEPSTAALLSIALMARFGSIRRHAA